VEIPFSNVSVVDKEEASRTWNMRRERNELIKLKILPLIPICTNLNSSIWCVTIVKVLCSTMRGQVTPLDTVEILRWVRFITVPRPFVTEASLLKRPTCL